MKKNIFTNFLCDLSRTTICLLLSSSWKKNSRSEMSRTEWIESKISNRPSKLILLKKINHKWSGGAEPMHRFLWILFHSFFSHCSLLIAHFTISPLISMNILFINVAYFPSFIYIFLRCELVPCIWPVVQQSMVTGDIPETMMIDENPEAFWCLYSIVRKESTIPTMGSGMVRFTILYRFIPNIGYYKIHTMWK